MNPFSMLAVLSLGLAGAAQVPPNPGQLPPSAYVYSTDQAIRFFQDRIRRDSVDASNHALLGQLYVRKARELNDFASYELASQAFREALRLNPEEVTAKAGAALVHCARHEFEQGLKMARQLQASHPREGMVLLLVGDAHLELGHYDQAERAYEDVRRADPQAGVLSRLARLAEMKGRTSDAIKLMEQAAAEERRGQVTRESGAWYAMRLGEMNFNAGRHEEAAGHYQAALKDHPRYPAALLGLGRVRAAQGQLDEAIVLCKQAVGINADVPMLAELGDLYARAGNQFLAGLNYEKLERAAANQSAYDRELALFYANHDRELPRALDLAKKDLAARQDVFAYDTLAWTLLKNGHAAEAAKAMTEALRLGTQDAAMFYHAGMISKALGEKARARQYLERALALNPGFSLTQADRAREALKGLDDAGK